MKGTSTGRVNVTPLIVLRGKYFECDPWWQGAWQIALQPSSMDHA